MAVNSGMAHLSDTLFTTAIAIYTLAMICYAAEYAFGRRGRIAMTSRTTPAIPVGSVCAAAGAASHNHAPTASTATFAIRTISCLLNFRTTVGNESVVYFYFVNI